MALGVCSGCVPVTRFEETQSAAQVEMAGRRRAETRLADLQTENEQLKQQLDQQNSRLEQRADALAQAELDKSMQGKERADAEGMVEQLRGELARVGGHLNSFNEDKQKLEASMQVETSRTRALARLSRDVALALPEPIAMGEYSLDAEQIRVVLRVPRDKVLADDGSVKPEADALLKTVARLLQLHPQSKLRVEDASAPNDAIAASRIVTALVERAVAAERFESLAADQAAGEPAAAGGVPEIVLGFSVP